MRCEPRLPFWLIAVLALVFNRIAIAHPLSQGSIDVRVETKSISVRARVTVEEVAVTNEATTPGAKPGPWATQAPTAFEQHAAYLASHLHILADGVTLAGGVVSVKPPDSVDPLINASAEYELIYAIPAGHQPKLIQIQDDVLTDGNFAPGATWDVTYVVKISVPGGPSSEGMLLTRANPVKFDCVASAAGGSKQASKSSLFKAYLYHGIHHILTGYDHLLFVSALVLAAVSFWDLVKVVSAFTLAHSITLTLAALNLIHLPERVVEPLIAASIVFVAVQNVFWPSKSRGWSRLGAAFFFGLFHGLGFAGGLMDAMREMQSTTMLLAILAFSIGVEAGHQMVVIPLFAFLKAARHTQDDAVRRTHLSMAFQRIGSAGISIAGMYYLCLALTGNS